MGREGTIFDFRELEDEDDDEEVFSNDDDSLLEIIMASLMMNPVTTSQTSSWEQRRIGPICYVYVRKGPHNFTVEQLDGYNTK